MAKEENMHRCEDCMTDARATWRRSDAGYELLASDGHRIAWCTKNCAWRNVYSGPGLVETDSLTDSIASIRSWAWFRGIFITNDEEADAQTNEAPRP